MSERGETSPRSGSSEEGRAGARASLSRADLWDPGVCYREAQGSRGCRSGIEPGFWGHVAGEPEQHFFGDLVQFFVPVV